MRTFTRLAPIGVAMLALALNAWRPLGARQAPDQAQAAGALDAAIAAIAAGRLTTPLVDQRVADGDATVTFLAQASEGRAPRIVSDVTGWGEHVDGTFDFTVGAMTRVGTSDWYALQTTVAPGARVEYLLAYGDTDYRLDPHNPRRLEAPRASELVTPGYQPPPELADPPASPAGALIEHTVESAALGGPCRLVVYTPTGARADDERPLAVFYDFPAVRQRQASGVLDWLIAREAIDPVAAVFVDPGSRGEAALAAGPMHAFLTGELPAWLSSQRLAASAARRAIIGISFGAKDALDAALSPAGAYGRLGLLIPGRRIGPADLETIAERRTGGLQVAILAGRYDQANLATARGLRQALGGAGHAVDYLEVPEGHSPRTWLGHLRDVLVSLFGRV